MAQTGQKLFKTFFQNMGGLNLTDSTFAIKDEQATGGFNYEYVRTGGIQSSLAPSRLNAVANAQLKTLGLFLRNTQTNEKTIIRAAGTKIQLTDLMGSFTDLSDDTSSAASDFLTSNVQPVIGTMTTGTGSDVLWLAGGGMPSLTGVVSYTPPTNATVTIQGLLYTAVKSDITGNAISVEYVPGGTAGSEVVTVTAKAIRVTIAGGLSSTSQIATAIAASAPATALVTTLISTIQPQVFQAPTFLAGGGRPVQEVTQVTTNGAANPQGVVTATEIAATGGTWITVGKYWYAFALHKKSTGALSNAALDVQVEVTDVMNAVFIDFSGLTDLDTTKYDQIYIYRSEVTGVSGFTTGELVAMVDSSVVSFVDTGTELDSAENIPRPRDVILDNEILPEGTYQSVCLWKRRLVTYSNSQIFISDLNKFEAWPQQNYISVPTGGKITAIASVSFTTPTATTTDEFLAVFKDSECWIITGNDYTDFSLKLVDYSGCLGPALVTSANGYLFSIDNRGIYLWDGAGKPIYISRPIEDLFGVNGTIDRSKLQYGFGTFFRRQNEVVWALTNTDLPDDQTYLLKLDVRLTLPSVSNTLGQRILDGVFLQGKVSNSAFAGTSFVFPTSSNQEDVFVTGDDQGYLYRQFYSYQGVGTDDVDFSYDTKFLECDLPGIDKNFEKVIVWVENVGNWNLTLDYWTDFKSSEDEKNTIPAVISSATDGTVALWDVAKWDQAKWDGYSSRPKSITYNLRGAANNNAQGEVIKLRFRNNGSDEPITIYGYSIVYSEVSLRK